MELSSFVFVVLFDLVEEHLEVTDGGFGIFAPIDGVNEFPTSETYCKLVVDILDLS